MTPEFLTVIDTETCGLDDKAHEIVEVYARKIRRLNKEVVDEFYSLCEPAAGMIPAEATAIHGISFDMVKGHPNYFTGGIQAKIAEFCAGTLVVGHNLIGYDLRFLKIEPEHVDDTMILYKKKFPGKKYNLQACCNSLKIKFDSKDAHGAKYDVDRTVELYFAITGEGVVAVNAFDAEVSTTEVAVQTPVAAMVQAIDVTKKREEHESGINLSMDKIKSILSDMAWSYSKLSAFMQCPFRFYKDYVEKYKAPDKTYFQVGHICHSVAEKSAVHCNKQTFAARFALCLDSERIPFECSDDWNGGVAAEYEDVNNYTLGLWIYDHPMALATQSKFKKMSSLIVAVGNAMSYDELVSTSVTMPNDVEYETIFNISVLENKVGDPDVINDAKRICRTFRRTYSFDTSGKAIILAERKLAFDKDWNLLPDFFSKKSYWRGIMDYMEYHEDHVVIRDYKSSRKELTLDQIQADYQLLSYAANAIRMVPKIMDMPIRVEIVYMRTGHVVGFDITDNKKLIADVDLYIKTVSGMVLDETNRSVAEMFAPHRNNMCGTCTYCENNMCPLFSKTEQTSISDPATFIVNNDETCMMAYKQAEANAAEAKLLMSLVKEYIKSKDGSGIVVDDTAEVNFYTDEKLEINPLSGVQMLLKAGAKLPTILGEMSLSMKAFTFLCAMNKIELKDNKTYEEEVLIHKTKTTFDCRVPGAQPEDE